jgi:hypothetical protein
MSFKGLIDFLGDNPLVVFTADQDWAPEWANQIFIDEVSRVRVPMHIFRTNASPVIDESVNAGILTQGWHPNFKANSTHGDSISNIISHMHSIAPASRTVRAHSYFETSEIWDCLYRAGQIVESHGVTDMEINVVPLRMASRMIRLPVFFEDDVFFRNEPDELNLSFLKQRLLTPGLKLLDFHPIHIAMNTSSIAHYESVKFKLEKKVDETSGSSFRGIRTVFNEIVGLIRQEKIEVRCLEMLVDQMMAND